MANTSTRVVGYIRVSTEGQAEGGISLEAQRAKLIAYAVAMDLELVVVEEALLQRSRPVLYRNQLGFIFYTPAGAALARQSDALQQRVRTSCGPQDQAAS